MAAREKRGRSPDMLSYLVIMDLVIAEDYKDGYDEFDSNPTKRNAIHAMLYDDLLNSGARIMVEGRELYSKIYTFDKYKDCRPEDSFGGPIGEVDFSSVVAKDIWAYIYGVYLGEERLGAELEGFALIRI